MNEKIKALIMFVIISLVQVVNAQIVSEQGVIDSSEVNASAMVTTQQGFNEQQGVTLRAGLMVDTGVIPEGSSVDSHMIFLNRSPIMINPEPNDFVKIWEFDGRIIGVMSDRYGMLEIASTELFSVSGVSYPSLPSVGRGLEVGISGSYDNYIVSENQLVVSMTAYQSADWIRVITDPNVKKVTVCYFPSGNPENAREKTISINALPSFLDDKYTFVGTCN